MPAHIPDIMLRVRSITWYFKKFKNFIFIKSSALYTIRYFTTAYAFWHQLQSPVFYTLFNHRNNIIIIIIIIIIGLPWVLMVILCTENGLFQVQGRIMKFGKTVKEDKKKLFQYKEEMARF
jgi:hypothetical protein